MESSIRNVLPAAGILALLLAPELRAAQTDIAGAVGRGLSGRTATVLPHGSFVATEPGYDAPIPWSEVGAGAGNDGGAGFEFGRVSGATR